ncbi:primase-helicase family protein [Paraburkholderia sp. EG287A]|uniref:primase-helicase family protein n=1 Tax=Paraburkholderia sp. EG287A TaxID=3237012 RepID=UPI0034D2A4BA
MMSTASFSPNEARAVGSLETLAKALGLSAASSLVLNGGDMQAAPLGCYAGYALPSAVVVAWTERDGYLFHIARIPQASPNVVPFQKVADNRLAELFESLGAFVRGQSPDAQPSPPPAQQNPVTHRAPAPVRTNDPVVAKLKADNLYKAYVGAGKHEISCPWRDEHTGDPRTAYYVEPTTEQVRGLFECHCCGHRHIADLLARFKLDPDTPANVVGALVAELNTKYAVVTNGGQTLILTETTDARGQPDIAWSRIEDLRTYFANRAVRRKGKSICIAQVWLESRDRRTYNGVVFDPSGATSRDYFNLWRGFAVKPKHGSCACYLQHIREVLAQGNERLYRYILTWMADCVQHPAARPGIALVLRGKEGTGKGVFARWFGALFGPHYLQITQARHLTGNFNAHLKDKLVVFLDEAFWAGDRAAEGPLKALITEDLLQIEPKGRDPFTVCNHMRFLMATNNDWAVPAGLNARRFAVFDVSDSHMRDEAYFAAIAEEMENGGLEALLDYLLSFDTTAIKLRDIPKTAALLEQKIHSMTPLQRFWLGILQRGTLRPNDDDWTCWVTKEDLRDEFLGGKSDRASETEFGMGLRKLVPDLRDCRKTINRSRPYVYEFPSLAACRDVFEKAIGQPIEWEEPNDDKCT